MSSSRFYWSRNTVNGFGKMWFPLVLRELNGAEDNALLGSVVEELSSGLLSLGEHYPAPNSMSDPNLVLKVLASMSRVLDLQEPKGYIETRNAIPDQEFVFSRGVGANVGVGTFPAIPADIGLTIDYSSLEYARIHFGNNTIVRHIPVDYLARLHRKFKGDASRIDPDVSIPVQDHYIVKSVLIAKDYSMEFQSGRDFSTTFDARVALVNQKYEGKINFQRASARNYVVDVKNTNPYMIGFSVVDWDDLG